MLGSKTAEKTCGSITNLTSKLLLPVMEWLIPGQDANPRQQTPRFQDLITLASLGSSLMHLWGAQRALNSSLSSRWLSDNAFEGHCGLSCLLLWALKRRLRSSSLLCSLFVGIPLVWLWKLRMQVQTNVCGWLICGNLYIGWAWYNLLYSSIHDPC